MANFVPRRRRKVMRKTVQFLALAICIATLIFVVGRLLPNFSNFFPLFNKPLLVVSERANSCTNPTVGIACLNVDAFDGTGGQRGWRIHTNRTEVVKPFPDPSSYLPPADAATYNKWTTWSHKPAGMDHALPSKDYFSLGKTKPFFGNVNQPGVMKKLIEARSYKGEIIQFVMAGNMAQSLDLGLNLVFNLRDLGYDHWFVHGGRDNSTCIRLLAALPSAGCIWDTILSDEVEMKYVKDFGLNYVLWWMRWWVVGRLLRFGMNVAQWDADVTIHDDMYKYFKSEPMKGINWVCGCEGTCSGMACNGGTNYIQNVLPNGPSVWVVWQIIEREARCMADWPAYEKISIKGSCVMDQITLNSALLSARTGVMVAPVSQGQPKDWEPAYKLRGQTYIERASHPAPAFWEERFGVSQVKTFRANLSIPSDHLPEGFHSIFPTARPAVVSRMLDTLQSESGAPHFDVESVPMGDRNPVPPETLGQIGNEFISLWISGYYEGKWAGMRPPKTVVAHQVANPAQYLRPYLLKALGWYHWKIDDLVGKMSEHYLPYFSSTASVPLPRVLLYTPTLTFNNGTQQEQSQLIFSLAMAAMMSGRHLMLPPVACGAPWLKKTDPRECHEFNPDKPHFCWWHGFQWHYGHPYETMPLVDEFYTEDRLACQAVPHNIPVDCHKKLLLYADFKQMMTRHMNASALANVQPVPSNTLWYDMREPLGAPPTFTSATLRITALALATKLEEYSDQHAVYLNAVPLIQAADTEEIKQKLNSLGSGGSTEGSSENKSGHERAKDYLNKCGDEPLGMQKDVFEMLLEESKRLPA